MRALSAQARAGRRAGARGAEGGRAGVNPSRSATARGRRRAQSPPARPPPAPSPGPPSPGEERRRPLPAGRPPAPARPGAPLRALPRGEGHGPARPACPPPRPGRAPGADLQAGPSAEGGVKGAGGSPSRARRGPAAQGGQVPCLEPASLAWRNGLQFQTSPGPKTRYRDSQAPHRPQLGLQLRPLSQLQSEGFKAGRAAFQKGGPALHALLARLVTTRAEEISGHSCPGTG